MAIAYISGRDSLVNPPLGAGAPGSTGRTAALVLLAICLGTGLAHALASRWSARVALARRPGTALAAALRDRRGRRHRRAPSGTAVRGVQAATGRRRDVPGLRPVAPPEQQRQRAMAVLGRGRRAVRGQAGVRPRSGHVRRVVGSSTARWPPSCVMRMSSTSRRSVSWDSSGSAARGGIPGRRRRDRPQSARREAGGRYRRGRRRDLHRVRRGGRNRLDVGAGRRVDRGARRARLAIGPATEPDPEIAAAPPAPRRNRGLHPAARVVAFVAIGAVIVAQGIPYLSASQLARSESAAGRGDIGGAQSAALAARDLEPWASSPLLQLALLAEQSRDLRGARGWIDQAIKRDHLDWRLWLVAARLATKAGDVERGAEGSRPGDRAESAVTVTRRNALRPQPGRAPGSFRQSVYSPETGGRVRHR